MVSPWVSDAVGCGRAQGRVSVGGVCERWPLVLTVMREPRAAGRQVGARESRRSLEEREGAAASSGRVDVCGDTQRAHAQRAGLARRASGRTHANGTWRVHAHG